MTKVAIPESWRDLSHAELVKLLERRPPMFRKSDLVWAKWEVASEQAVQAAKAHVPASSAMYQAMKAWHAKGDSASLATFERARAAEERVDRIRRGAERREERLYALHQRLREAEA